MATMRHWTDRLKLKKRCAGCKHEMACWTMFHDGLDCYEPAGSKHV